MTENKIEVYDYSLTTQIEELRQQKMNVSQIAFALNLNYLELKQYLTDLAVDEKAATGNSTAVQIQMKRDIEKQFQKIKSDVWELDRTI